VRISVQAFRQALRIYLGAVRQLPVILGKATLGFTAVITAIGSIIGYFGIKLGTSLISWWENLSPWWGAILPIALVVLVLFLVAVNRQFQEIEEECNELRGRLQKVVQERRNLSAEVEIFQAELERYRQNTLRQLPQSDAAMDR
jgi:hypothetical protein